MSVINVVISDVNDAGNRFQVVGTFQLSNANGGYNSAGAAASVGDVLSFAAATTLRKGDMGLAASEAPILLQITSRASGYTVNYLKDPAPPAGFGPRRDFGGLRIFTSGNAEFANGAYNAAQLADTFDFIAEFRKLV